MDASAENHDGSNTKNDSHNPNEEGKDQHQPTNPENKTENKQGEGHTTHDDNKIPHGKPQEIHSESKATDDQSKAVSKEKTKESSLNNDTTAKQKNTSDNTALDEGVQPKPNQEAAHIKKQPQASPQKPMAELPMNIKQARNSPSNGLNNGEVLKKDIENKKKNKEQKVNKTFKASDPTKIYINRNDSMLDGSPKRRGSRASVNSLQKTGQYSTISKDFNNGSQYDSNPRMRNTFGNISVDYRKSERDTIGKLYRNITGPGQYEQHQMTGKYVVDSRKFNQPSFSFGLKQDFYERKPPIISKEHRVDFYNNILNENIRILTSI